jgi:excisionase family DNA binding protein
VSVATKGTTLPRVAFSLDEAAAALAISRDTLERHVLPELRVLRVGRRVVIPLRELERWAERNASRPLEAELKALGR